ncbi:hypothetical protein BX616_002224, partial [Lobosporangium transversale]
HQDPLYYQKNNSIQHHPLKPSDSTSTRNSVTNSLPVLSQDEVEPLSSLSSSPEAQKVSLESASAAGTSTAMQQTSNLEQEAKGAKVSKRPAAAHLQSSPARKKLKGPSSVALLGQLSTSLDSYDDLLMQSQLKRFQEMDKSGTWRLDSGRTIEAVLFESSMRGQGGFKYEHEWDEMSQFNTFDLPALAPFNLEYINSEYMAITIGSLKDNEDWSRIYRDGGKAADDTTLGFSLVDSEELDALKD